MWAMRLPGRGPASRAALAAWALGCALALLLSACGGSGPETTPPGGGDTTPGATVGPGSPTPGGATPGAGSPTPAPETTLLLVQEFGQNADTLRLVDPRDPSRSRTALVIEHAPGWGARVAISPDGRRVAYAVLPRNARDEARQAELWVASLEGGSPARQATGIDLRGGALWAADGSAVFARAVGPDSPLVVRVDQRGGTEPRNIATGPDVASLTLAGSHGRYIYWSELSRQTGQAVLKSLDLQTGQVGPGLTLASEPARDFALSPDGSRLAFTGANTFKAYLADLTARSVSELPTDGQPALRPAWLPDGSAVAVGLAAGGGRPARVLVFRQGSPQELVSVQQGFLQPLLWTPDGSALLCQYYTGTLSNPGNPALVSVTTGGQPASLPVSGQVEVVGWARGRL